MLHNLISKLCTSPDPRLLSWAVTKIGRAHHAASKAGDCCDEMHLKSCVSLHRKHLSKGSVFPSGSSRNTDRPWQESLQKKKSLESSLERKTENRRIQYPGERRQLLAEIIFNLIMLRVI